MGIGAVLLLWTLLAIAASVVAIAAALLFVSGLRRRRPIRAAIGGVIAGGAAVVALGAVVFVVSWLVLGGRSSHSTSRSDFRGEFGFDAPADVTAVESESSGSTDSLERYLHFRASPQTIAAIARRHFRSAPVAECANHFPALRDRPQWWRPTLSESSACYVAHPFDDAFASNDAWLVYDRATGDAHYYYIGID